MNSAYFKISLYNLVIVSATDSQHPVCLLIVKENNLNVKFVFGEHLVCFSGCPLVEITSSLTYFLFHARQNLYFHALFRLRLPSEGIRYGRCFLSGYI